MENENKWIKTWLYGFHINTRAHRLIFETGPQSMWDTDKTFPYYRDYSEDMVQELKKDNWLLDKTLSLITSHKFVSILIGKRKYYSIEWTDQVLDIKAQNYPGKSSHDGFFRDTDIPYEGLTDDEKDAW